MGEAVLCRPLKGLGFCWFLFPSTAVPGSGLSRPLGTGFTQRIGIAWFAGSAVMGILYEKSISGLVIFSVAVQLLALPFFSAAMREPT
jgi:hypothetical protein